VGVSGAVRRLEDLKIEKEYYLKWIRREQMKTLKQIQEECVFVNTGNKCLNCGGCR
jgi:hypothetical protein